MGPLARLFGGGAPSAPTIMPAAPPPPAPMPVPDDSGARLAAQRAVASSTTSGRDSTILSDANGTNDKLGA